MVRHEPITAVLQEWWFDDYNHVFWGIVIGDIKGRFVDGAYIHTSSCHNPDAQEGDVIKTRNSTYLLGKPKPKVD